MKIAFIVVLLVFYTAFLLKAFLLSKSGIKVNIMFKDKFRSKTQIFTLMSGVFSVALAVLSVLFDLGIHNIWGLKALGFAVSVIGTLVFLKAIIDMKSSWRVGVNPNEKTKLVTNGIYSISRNPAYLGFDLMYIGILIAYFEPLIAVFFIAYIISLDMQARIEEEFLHKSFGEAYENYKNKINRYFGITKYGEC